MNKIRKPLLVDSSIHTAFAIKYAIYGLFGLLGAISGSPTLERVAGESIARIIATVIFIASVFAATACISSVKDPEGWERVELYSTISVVSFVSMYCISAVFLVMQGDVSRASLAMIAAAMLVFPMWRIVMIVRKIRRDDVR